MNDAVEPHPSTLMTPCTKVLPAAVRRLVLEVAGASGVGHVGSCLSIVEIVTALLGHVVRVSAVDDPARDRLILSKGHGALTLYAALHLAGTMDRETLATYASGAGPLGVHPDHRLGGIDFSTGSLGMGISYGVGSALAARVADERRRIFVVGSDAELNAGMSWEAIQFAGHHGLHELALVIDANGQQALGRTADILDLEPLVARFEADGWEAVEVPGHDEAALVAALRRPRGVSKPLAVVARTVSGKGVSFMEGQVEWHYLPMTAEQRQQAFAEVDASS